jgi:hypothetical protein
MLYLELVNLTDHLLDALDARIAKLEKLIAVNANQVIVLPVTEGTLVLGLIGSKLVPYDQVAVEEEVECIVDGGPADAATSGPHAREKFIGVDMVCGGIDHVEHCEPFGCLALVPFLQKGTENPAHLIQTILRKCCGHTRVLLLRGGHLCLQGTQIRPDYVMNLLCRVRGIEPNYSLRIRLPDGQIPVPDSFEEILT